MTVCSPVNYPPPQSPRKRGEKFGLDSGVRRNDDGGGLRFLPFVRNDKAFLPHYNGKANRDSVVGQPAERLKPHPTSLVGQPAERLEPHPTSPPYKILPPLR